MQPATKQLALNFCTTAHFSKRFFDLGLQSTAGLLQRRWSRAGQRVWAGAKASIHRRQ